ncbi:hypothetical protein ABZ446_28515 [Streptomyces sp. NPDC005813]|uniref:hypothetical protein n=1 Tax=Streptomyces sp. NPDC005813 TaxID=3155592 RepID=UPI0033C6B106
MTAFIARLIFETWAAQYDPEATSATTRDHHLVLSSVAPHLYAPMVPATFRGPKWGTR